MRAVRFTKGEAEFLRERLEPLTTGQLVGTMATRAKMILAKLTAAEEAPKGVNPVVLEQALIKAAPGKVVPLSTGWPRVAKMAAYQGATIEDAGLVGAWMMRQGWLHGPQTLLDVLNKWPQWLAKAKATEPPPALSPGFGEKTDGKPVGATEASGASPAGGRQSRGFR
jgi:hypothetical protein